MGHVSGYGSAMSNYPPNKLLMSDEEGNLIPVPAWSQYTLVVEVQPMCTPKPVGIIILAGGKPCGVLTIEQVREALKRWDELEAAYKAVR
jgi:hypothetical protein